MKRGVKGQVTIFVIVAILLVAAFGVGYFLLKNNSPEEQTQEELQQQTEIPQELKPLANYVESCIKQVTIEAVKQASEHGGYINPSDLRYPTNLDFQASKPTESDFVSLTQDDDSLVPYYLHIPGKASSDNYQAVLSVPSDDTIQKQIAWHLEDNVPNCLDEFSSFKEDGLEVKADGIYVFDVVIKDETIDVLANIPLTAIKDDKINYLSRFNSQVRTQFRKNLDLAAEISATAYITQFSESFSSSLIQYYSGEDPTLLPPKLHHSSNIYPITWSKPKVKQDFNNLLLSYVPAIKVSTEAYKNIDSDDITQNFIDSLIFYISNETSNKSQITFFYPDQTIDLSIAPSKGNLIKPFKEEEKGDKFKPDQVDFTYKFYYDVSYPLIIEIRTEDPNSDIPKNSFLFAIESNIIENKPGLMWEMGAGTADWDSDYMNMDFSVINDESQSQNQIEEAKAREDTKSLFCNEATFTSGEITVTTVDGSRNPLLGAQIYYSCGEYDTCSLGETTMIDNQATWTGKLPICEGGILAITKTSHASQSYELTTQEGSSILMPTTELAKEKSISVSVKKREISKVFNFSKDDNAGVWNPGPVTINDVEDLNAEEQVILTINQVNQEYDAVSTTIIFGKDGVESQNVNLVPGDYEIYATLIDYNGITFPAKCNTLCKVPVVICFDWYEYPESETVIDTISWGGVDINSNSGIFEIKKEQLDNSRNIEFYVVKLPNLQNSEPPGACIEQLDEMDKIADYTSRFRNELQPVFN